uniref:Sushi domain-containing protein n=1 Tax=Amphimedon queenslandica TaxID=400682 RepID=A0A1X7UIE0_AMPQE
MRDLRTLTLYAKWEISGDLFIPRSAVCYGFSGTIANSANVYISQGFSKVAGRYSEGTIVSYSCNDHFAPLDGHTTVQCTTSGSWSPNVPQCAVSCPALNKPSNGALSTTATSPGVIVTLYCNDGYMLHGTPNITCLVNGYWSNTLATCNQLICPNLVLVPHLVIENTPACTPGSVITFSCEAGFVVSGNRTILCDKTGHWNSTLPSCISSNSTNTNSTNTNSTNTNSTNTAHSTSNSKSLALIGGVFAFVLVVLAVAMVVIIILFVVWVRRQKRISLSIRSDQDEQIHLINPNEDDEDEDETSADEGQLSIARGTVRFQPLYSEDKEEEDDEDPINFDQDDK